MYFRALAEIKKPQRKSRINPWVCKYPKYRTKKNIEYLKLLKCVMLDSNENEMSHDIHKAA